MGAGLAENRCNLCGSTMRSGFCPHCDRPGRGPLGRAFSRLRRPARARRLVVAVLTACVLAAGYAVALEAGHTRGAAQPRRAEAATSPAPVAPAEPPPGLFEVLGGTTDEFGHQTLRGWAFVVRSGPATSDLITDYFLVVDEFMRGDGTVLLGRAAQQYSARIVAVSPDPHVALLRIDGVYPALPIGATEPAAGQSATLLVAPGGTAVEAQVVAYPGQAAGHLTFSVMVAQDDDGAPVLNTAGQVVGMAEPSVQFGARTVGFAVPMSAVCSALAVC